MKRFAILLTFAALFMDTSTVLACPVLDRLVGTWTSGLGTLIAGNAQKRYDLKDVHVRIEKSGEFYAITSCGGSAINADWICQSGLIYSDGSTLYATNGSVERKAAIGACVDHRIAMRANNNSGGWTQAPLAEVSWAFEESNDGVNFSFELDRKSLPYRWTAVLSR